MSYNHITENERYVISHLKSSFSNCLNNQALVKCVHEKLRLDWPPEVIAAMLRFEFSEDEQMRISHKTIYRWAYLDASQKGDLHTHLRRRHKKRRRQKSYGSGRRFIPGRVSIDLGPAIVGTRERFGAWEGDTVESAKGTGGVATHVERKSRYLLAVKLTDKKADTMTERNTKSFRCVPKGLRKTLTVDNGKEFSRFKELEENTGLEVFFAAPCGRSRRKGNLNARVKSFPVFLYLPAAPLPKTLCKTLLKLSGYKSTNYPPDSRWQRL